MRLNRTLKPMKTITTLDDRRIETRSEELKPDLLQRSARNPRLATLLSLVPGIGQIYNGEWGKGLLFLAVAIANALLILVTLFHVPLLTGLCHLVHFLPLSPNWQATTSLASTLETKLVSGVYLALLFAFIVYACKDAYSNALLTRQGTTFPKYFLGMPEATSGSYLFHFAIVASLVAMVLFVVVPITPQEHVTNIEFVAEPPPLPVRHKPVHHEPANKEVKPTPRPVVQPPPQVPVAIAVPSSAPSPFTTEQKETPPELPPSSATGDQGGSTAEGGNGSAGEGSQEVDFGPYLAEMQRRIKKAWYPPRGNESKRVTVKFKLDSNGTVSAVRLEKSSGVSVADDAATAAIEAASPFGPLPKGAPTKVDIRFTFDYNVFNGGQNTAQPL